MVTYKPGFTQKDLEEKYDSIKLDPNESLKTQYSSFGYLLNELSIKRRMISELGVSVRLQDSQSKNFVQEYLSRIQDCRILASSIIAHPNFKLMDNLSDVIGKQIIQYFKKLKMNRNMPVPTELIKNLDLMQEMLLVTLQKIGLSMPLEENQTDILDKMGKAIEGQ